MPIDCRKEQLFFQGSFQKKLMFYLTEQPETLMFQPVHTEETGVEHGATRQASGGILQYVRTAEELIRGGKYGVALDALAVAKELEPNDPSVQPLVEKVLHAQARMATSSFQRIGVATLAEQGGRYLGVTVGREFGGGIRGDSAGDSASESGPINELEERIRFILDVAESFLMRGMTESAFESLMCAYMLDPLAPDVIRSEERILPVLEALGSGPRPGGRPRFLKKGRAV